jgi:hypothetical protein
LPLILRCNVNETTDVEASGWEHGVIHLVWWRAGNVRRLIFGWVELLPSGVPMPANHPFRRKPVLGAKDRFVHVARFPMSAQDAMRWFEQARSGTLLLPSHPLSPTNGDGACLEGSPTILEPLGDEWTLADELPFAPRIHGAAEVRGLHGALSPGVAADIGSEDFDAWFRKTMFFSLLEHNELQGSLLCVRYDPVIRGVDSLLVSDDEANEAEVYRVTRWPKAVLEGMRLIVTQRRPHGISRPKISPIARAGQVIKVQWQGKINQTSSEVVDDAFSIRWHSGFTGYFRQVRINPSVIVGTDRIEISEDGKIIDSYSVSRRLGRGGNPSFAGEALKPDSFQVEAEVARARREERAALARYEPMWLEEEQEAADVVRGIVTRAASTVWLFDPYFSARAFLRFVLAVAPGSATVEVFTSASHLKTRLRLDPTRRELDGVQSAMNEIMARGTDARLFVLPGGVHPMHDRFVVVDGSRAWMSGNSLSAIGRRTSVLLELPLAGDVIDRLKEVRRAARPFSEWLAGVESGSSEGSIDDLEDDEPV